MGINEDQDFNIVEDMMSNLDHIVDPWGALLFGVTRSAVKKELAEPFFK